MPFRLVVPSDLLAALIAQARAELPNECCGLLGGTILTSHAVDTLPVAQVVVRYPLANAAASPRRFESDPRQMFDALRDLDRHGLDLLAVYHSHPTSLAVPSRTDLEWNLSPRVVTFIVSLASEPPQLGAWWLTATDFTPAEWEERRG
jgi:[CysO sulfur-carrier protein]-S-L-cysteine hydrolase